MTFSLHRGIRQATQWLSAICLLFFASGRYQLFAQNTASGPVSNGIVDVRGLEASKRMQVLITQYYATNHVKPKHTNVDVPMALPPPSLAGLGNTNIPDEKLVRASVDTNDPIQTSLESQIVAIEKDLKSTDLDPAKRRYDSFQFHILIYQLAFEQSRSKHTLVHSDEYNKIMSKHREAEQLFSNVMKAETDKNPEEIALAKQALAKHLSEELAEKRGIHLSTNQSYEEVTAEFRNQFHKKTTAKNHIILYALLLLAALPLIAWVVIWARDRAIRGQTAI